MMEMGWFEFAVSILAAVGAVVVSLFVATYGMVLLVIFADIVAVHHAKFKAKRDNEINRLKAGDLTPEEFQNLCHNLHLKDKPCTRQEFQEGCQRTEEQIFGKQEFVCTNFSDPNNPMPPIRVTATWNKDNPPEGGLHPRIETQ